MKKLAFPLLLGCLVFLPRLALAAGAQSDDISWTHPVSRTDGTALALSEIARTELEVVKDGTTLAPLAVTAPANTTTRVREAPATGTICYRARTVATDNQVSDWSNQVCKLVKGRPNAPQLTDVK